jgi:hypothetical protein
MLLAQAILRKTDTAATLTIAHHHSHNDFVWLA